MKSVMRLEAGVGVHGAYDHTETAEIQVAREYYQKGDIKMALRKMPKYMRIERTILTGLQNHGPSAFLNAFSMVCG